MPSINRASEAYSVPYRIATVTVIFRKFPMPLGSVVEPAAQLAERDHDVLAIGRSLLEAPVPSLDVRHGRQFDVDLEIAVERGADRDVGERQGIAGHEA